MIGEPVASESRFETNVSKGDLIVLQINVLIQS